MLTQRSLAQAFLALQAVLTALLAIALTVHRSSPAWAAGMAALACAGCWVAFRRGWRPARHVAVITFTLLLVIGAREPYLRDTPMIGVLLPPIFALMLTSAPWIVASGGLALIGLSVRGGGASAPLLQPLELGIFIMAVSGLVLTRLSLDNAIARLALQAQQADEARLRAEAAAQDAIAERNRATKLEAALLHLQRLESVGRLAGGVAHDFNNLLTVIGASTSMAERAIASGASPAEDLNEVHLAVARASELTKQLLAFARKQVLVKRGVELNELIVGVERMLERLLGESTSLSTQLCPEGLPVLADAGQIEQVVVNLVLNARDAMGGHGVIELRTRRLPILPGSDQELEGLSIGDYACIEVRDSGVGMTPEVQRQLFEPFFTTKSPGRGTGLGLSTCFGIVRQHDGAIHVDSEPGKGTTMRVLLPLTAVGEARVATSGVVPVSERPRVLVVEDEPQVRAIAARTLSNAGFEVQQAPNGAAALKLIDAEKRFDVIVTDVLMPELNGVELARAVRAKTPDMELVFMSGYPEALQGVSPDELVGYAFLAKPFAPQQLVEIVRERLEHHVSAASAHA